MQKKYNGSSCVNENNREYHLDYYVVSEEKFFDEYGKTMVTYGIEIVEDATYSEIVNDVTTSEDKVTNIIDKLKFYNVMPVHLHDVIENII